MNRDAGITLAAQSAGQHVMFEFTLRLLATAIANGRTPEARSALTRVLQEAVRLHRGENLSMPPGLSVEAEKLPMANAAYRGEIQRCTDRLLESLGV